MNLWEILQENEQIFLRSGYYMPLLQPNAATFSSLPFSEPLPQRERPPEQAGQQEGVSRVTQERQEQPSSPQIVREEQVVTVEGARRESNNLRAVSDELERLSQRYGRDMEEWLYDQSTL